MNRLLAKVCGITRPEDARLAAALGADLLGFIFHPKSSRCVAPELPASLDKGADLLGALKVGVFVGQSADETRALMDAGRLDLAQLHGGQDEAFCAALGAGLGQDRIIKVLWPERAATVDAFQAEVDRFASLCRLFLVDAGSGGGGHGRAVEERAAEILAATRFPKPWLLAGGLGPDTIGPALARFRPSGLDLNSGVERAPGIKDKTKLREAFSALRAAQTKGENP
ncbi:MAG: phosphoribosylanthranilate isomerase [Humidesulfovibrio sp.]|nr:phosphoribosylanthranilate isomerase [Humidesulfovibrio sp.]